MDPSRTTTSSMQQDSHGKRSYQQMHKSHSAPGNYGSNWTGITPQHQADQVAVYNNPADYVAKLERSSDTSHNAAKRLKVEGSQPFLHVVCPYDVSPCASNSSNLSTPSLIASDAMSRQSSMMSTSSLNDRVGELCVESASSYDSDNMQFPIDAAGESFLSYATAKPSNNSIVAGLGQDAPWQWQGSMGNMIEYPQELSFFDSSSAGMIDGQDVAQGQAWLDCPSQDMQRSISDQSSTRSISAERKATDRQRKHLENASRPIASKCFPHGPVSFDSSKMDSKARPLRPQEPGTQRKEPMRAISKAPYIRPQHPKLKCDICTEYPDGFRGEHELRRHHERAHAHLRRVWICVDPDNTTKEGWRPTRPLDICKQCNQQKEYNVYYNAAAHLRRAHFCPRKRGRKARGEQRESRAGKAGGDWPPIDWLKNNGWLKEIEVGAEDVSASLIVPGQDSITDVPELEDDTFDDEVDFTHPADPSYDPNLSVFHDTISTDMLGFCQPMVTDFNFGYPTPALDAVMPWPNNGYSNCIPQAPAMEHTVSAPPALNSNMMYNYNGMNFYQ